MSTLIVDVCKVEEIASIPDADRIERVRVKNWWCVAGKGTFAIGDKAVYVPPDSVLPKELAERWGIAKYCCELGRDISGERPPGLRVRACRFRGVPSFGTIQKPDSPDWEVGTDVREHYGITKWEPPMRCQDGDAAPNISPFHEYTSIERFGDNPDWIGEHEEVVVTEKIHGTNSRVGMVYHQDENGQPNWIWVAGSHGSRRKEYNDKGARSKYWLPFKPLKDDEDGFDCPMRQLLRNVYIIEKAALSVVVYGEIFGAGVQDMQYGQKGLSYRIFDIAVDGNYIDWVKVEKYVAPFKEQGLELVPVLYRGLFSREKMDELVDGPTTLASADQINEPFKGREGVVIKPVYDRFTVKGNRCILKYVSADYHGRKNKNQTEDH